MVTALVSILLGTMAIRPRDKANLIKKEYLDEFSSVAYFQDMADVSPGVYLKRVKEILKDKDEVHEHIIKHVHILGSEIKVKYYWLKKAYTAFAIGLVLSATLMIIAMFQTVGVEHRDRQFVDIYEPSGAISLDDGKVLVVEDESRESLQLVELDEGGHLKELDGPLASAETKHIFQHKIRDLEGVTSNGAEKIYAITSHTTNRAHKRKVPREQIVRFDYQEGRISDVRLYHGLLESLKRLHPGLDLSVSSQVPFSRKDAINIEALTWDVQEKTLLIGLRSPLIHGKAVVVALTNPDGIFDDEEKVRLERPLLLDLDGYGIRGMSWDEKREGYWIIAGDVGKREKEFSLWFWDKKSHTTTKSVKNSSIGFAEGITTIDNGQILVVKDDGSLSLYGAGYSILNSDDPKSE